MPLYFLPRLLVLLTLLWTRPAAAELAIIVNPANPATKMFSYQAAQFFLGASAAFTPIEFGEDSPTHAEFCKKVLEKEPAELRAIWAKLVFTGKARPPRQLKSSADIKKMVAQTPNAIAYIPSADVDPSVKVVAIVP